VPNPMVMETCEKIELARCLKSTQNAMRTLCFELIFTIRQHHKPVTVMNIIYNNKYKYIIIVNE
jgi:hypothetical protein